MVLQTFIQNMLPEDGAAVYGNGMAGEMWKSMLAEKIAGVMAERGGIGIAGRMLGERYAAAEARPSGPGETAKANGTAPIDSRLDIAPSVLDAIRQSLSGLPGDGLSPPEPQVPSTTKRG